jgi:putative Holliday junction resolvase
VSSTPFPRSGRLLGVDFGSKRIGIAVCDPEQRIASPAGVLSATGGVRTAVRSLLDAVDRNGAVGIVVGLPLHMDGRDSPQTKAVRVFASRLAAASDIPP